MTESLNVDVLENLLVSLDNDQIQEFYLNPELKDKVTYIIGRNEFWWKRVGYLLDADLEYDERNWSKVYAELLPFTKEYNDYKEMYRAITNVNEYMEKDRHGLDVLRVRKGKDAKEINENLLILLIESGKVASNFDNDFPIRDASKKGLVNVVTFLLKDPNVDPAAKDNTPIIKAAKKRHFEIVKLLLADNRVDPNARDGNILDDVCQANNTKLLLEMLADPRVDPTISNTSLTVAAYAGFIEVVKILLKDGRMNPNDYALKNSVGQQNIEIANMLLADPRVDLSYDNSIALREACLRGNTDMVRRILAYPQVDPSAKQNKALENAIRYRNDEIGAMLLSDARTILSDEELENVSSVMVTPKLIRSISVLVSDDRYKERLNYEDYFERATKNKSVEIMRILLETGRVTKPAYNDNAAMKLAIRENQPDLVLILMKYPEVREKF